jgi:short-subunit dehydrogenase
MRCGEFAISYKELRDFGIRVSTIYPSSIQTNFFDEIPGVDNEKYDATN